MGFASLLLLGACATMGALGYVPLVKDHLISENVLREVVERMGRDLDSYLEEVTAPRVFSPDYQENLNIRDQEYLQHSSLWNNPYGQDLADEELQRLKPEEMKSKQKQDNTLPAYCDPPNPCPIGFTAKDGCLEEFENTAAFSREYQAQQECMCDTEHMFECNNNHNKEMSEIDRFVQRFQQENPYLQGDKLPIAAKKGNDIY